MRDFQGCVGMMGCDDGSLALPLFDDSDESDSRGLSYTPQCDEQLEAVAQTIRDLDPDGERMALVVRETFDQAYDGQRTGRWDYAQLHKTEKTHIGTLVEINLQREFRFADGRRLDYQIAGVDVDCKFSRKLNEWEIPHEMYDRGPQLALLIWGSDTESKWSAGLVRVSEDVLRSSRNQDGKRKLSDNGAGGITWLFRGRPMRENVLLHMPVADRAAVLASKSGQERINELLRRAQGKIIDRSTICTVAQQKDGLKRPRDARSLLAPEGIVVFGHYEPHPTLLRELGLPVPKEGEFVSARLFPWLQGDPEPHVTIRGGEWRLARQGEPSVPAPALPSQGREV